MLQIVSSMLTVIGRAELSELPKHVLESLHTCIVDKGYENMFPAETECADAGRVWNGEVHLTIN